MPHHAAIDPDRLDPARDIVRVIGSGSVENGGCTNKTLPCCWLKDKAGLSQAPSPIPGIASGVVVGPRRLPFPVEVHETFTSEPEELPVVRWEVNFTAAAKVPFGSASLDTV